MGTTEKVYIKVSDVVLNDDYTLTLRFSDGGEFVTNKSIRGKDGRNIHHVVHKRSIGPDGKEIAAENYAVNEGDTEIKAGTPGYLDIYDVYDDEEELTHVGVIKVNNGIGAYELAKKGGYKGTQEEFNKAIANMSGVTTGGGTGGSTSGGLTKAEVQQMINDSKTATMEISVLNSLPAVGKEKVIYLVPSSDPKAKDKKEEYLWVNGAFEKIGGSSVTIDTLTEAEVDAILNA